MSTAEEIEHHPSPGVHQLRAALITRRYFDVVFDGPYQIDRLNVWTSPPY
jgi:hypothetical protein